MREVDALRAKRGPSATSEPTHTCFSRAPLFRLGILMPFGEPASASPPGHWTSESGRRPFHSSVPASPRPSCRKGRACQVKLPTSVHDLRNRCSTSSGIAVPLPPDSVFHFPDSLFHFLRNRCSTSSGFRVPLPPEYPTFALSPGQAHDSPEGRKLLASMGPQDANVALVMDRAYQGDETHQLALDLGFTPVVPPLKTRTDPWEYDREMYKRRNEVERLFRRLKGYRRIFSRFEKLDVMFIGFIHFVLIFDALR